MLTRYLIIVERNAKISLLPNHLDEWVTLGLLLRLVRRRLLLDVWLLVPQNLLRITIAGLARLLTPVRVGRRIEVIRDMVDVQTLH